MQHLSEDLDSELTRDLHAMSARRERGQKAIEGTTDKCPLCSEQRKMGVLTAGAVIQRGTIASRFFPAIES